ncbi:MAG: hypothetical protein HON70_44240, partial [Lentisphaerae bacterium]|nr:hypothetical protein [Lentisphaerota bacterium]
MGRKRPKQSRWRSLLPWALLGLCILVSATILTTLVLLPYLANEVASRLLSKHDLAEHLRLDLSSVSFTGTTVGPIASQDNLGEIGIDSAIIRYTPRGLMRGRLDSLTISSLRITAVEEDGKWTIPGIEWLRRRNPEQSTPAPAPSDRPRSLPLIACEALYLRGGTLEIQSGDGSLQVPFEAQGTLHPNHTVTGTAWLRLLGQRVDITFEGTPADGNFTVAGHSGALQIDQLRGLRRLAMAKPLPASPWPVGQADVRIQATLKGWSPQDANVTLNASNTRVELAQTDIVLTQLEATIHMPADQTQATVTVKGEIAPLTIEGITIGKTEISGFLKELSASLQVTSSELAWVHGVTGRATAEVRFPLAPDFTPGNVTVSARLWDLIYKGQAIGGIHAELTGTREQFAFTLSSPPPAPGEELIALQGTGTVDLRTGIAGAFQGTISAAIPTLLTTLGFPDSHLAMDERLSLGVVAEAKGITSEDVEATASLELGKTSLAFRPDDDTTMTAEVAARVRGSCLFPARTAALQADVTLMDVALRHAATTAHVDRIELSSTMEQIAPGAPARDLRVRGKANAVNVVLELGEEGDSSLSGAFDASLEVAGTPASFTAKSKLHADTYSLGTNTMVATAQ